MDTTRAVALPTQAWQYRRAHVFFWAMVLVVLAGDLASKWWAFNYLPAPASTAPVATNGLVVGRTMTIVPGLLEFKTVLNRGAVFGLGKGGRWVFIIATFLATGFLLQLFAKSRANQRFLHSLLALSVGGAFGNLYDRLVHQVVRDFIHITAEIGSVPVWPAVFNVADIALVIGIGMLLVGWTFGYLKLDTVRPPARDDAANGRYEGTDDRSQHVDR